MQRLRIKPMTAWSEVQHPKEVPKEVQHPADSVLRCVCHAIQTTRNRLQTETDKIISILYRDT